MAPRYVALLRGINVGKAKRVAMADLRALVEGLGCSEVRTLLNSGNVVFTAARSTPAALGKRISGALTRDLGVTARVTVIGAADFAKVVAANPLLDVADDPSRLMVGFLAGATERKRVAPLVKQDWGREALALGSTAVYLWCPTGVLDSRALAAVGKLLGEAWTARNWATVSKLQALLEA